MKKSNRPVNLNKGRKDNSESEFSFVIDEMIRFIPMWIFFVTIVCGCIYVSELSHIASNESKVRAVTETSDNAVVGEDRKKNNDDLTWFILYNYYNTLYESGSY